MSFPPEMERRANELARLAGGDTVMHVTPEEQAAPGIHPVLGKVSRIITPWGVVSLVVRTTEPTPAELVAQWRDRAEKEYRRIRDGGAAYLLLTGCADALAASLAAQDRREHPLRTADL